MFLLLYCIGNLFFGLMEYIIQQIIGKKKTTAADAFACCHFCQPINFDPNSVLRISNGASSNSIGFFNGWRGKKDPNLLSVFMSMIMTNNALNYVFFIEMFLIILLLVVFGSERVFVSLFACLGACARVLECACICVSAWYLWDSWILKVSQNQLNVYSTDIIVIHRTNRAFWKW